MVTAIILLNVERNEIRHVAEKLVDIDGVSEVYSVTGRFDLVAIIRVKKDDDLADLVTEEMTKINGILGTETMIAFRAYSRHDLDRMFAIGFEK
ncbi:Lrp/AsnC ligand binding domain-containing protein [bacterium]|nr:Lrp/AsnC ligand binding domain-containing protein [bacterium]